MADIKKNMTKEDLFELGFEPHGEGYARNVGAYGFEYYNPSSGTLTIKNLVTIKREYVGIKTREQFRDAEARFAEEHNEYVKL